MKKHTALKQNIKNDTCIEFRRDIKALTLLADTTSSGNLFHSSIVMLSVRPSVRPSRAGVVSKLGLAYRLFSTYLTLCCKKIRTSRKITVRLSGTLPQTLDLEYFATASQWRCQQYWSSSTRSSLLMTVDESWLFIRSRSADKILTDIERRAVRLR